MYNFRQLNLSAIFCELILKLDPNRKRLLKQSIFLFPIIVILWLVFLRIEFIEMYWDLTGEDGFIEYAQSVLYFLSSVFALSIAISFLKTRHHLYCFLYLVLSLGFFFVCMEEIGWGQRIFSLTMPDYFKEHNVQGEFSLHNLGKVRPYVNELYVLIGFLGAFSWLMLPQKVKATYNAMVHYLVPNWFLTFYFFPAFAVYMYIAYISGIAVHWSRIDSFHIGYWDKGCFLNWTDQEPAELLLSLGFLFFVLINKYRQNTSKIFDKRKSIRLALTVLLGYLFIVVPLHMIHITLSERIYPYDHFDLGNILLGQGKFDEAIGEYFAALRIDPIHVQSHNNLALALQRQGRFNEAIRHFSEALRIKPTDAKLHNNLGNALMRQGRVEEAVAHYSEAVKIKPDSESFHYNLAVALERQGRLNDAISHYSEAVRIKPDFGQASRKLESVLGAQGAIE